MSKYLSQSEIEMLLDAQSPVAVLETMREQLDAEGVAYLEARIAFDQELGQLSDDVATMLPDPPPFERSAGVVAGPQDWWQRKLQVPVWASALAAAVMLAALLLPLLESPEQAVADPALPTFEEMLAHRRSVDAANDLRLQGRNDALFEALVDRAAYYIDQDDPAAYEMALADLELALPLKPDSKRCLRYLVMVCEALNMEQRLATYRGYLESL